MLPWLWPLTRCHLSGMQERMTGFYNRSTENTNKIQKQGRGAGKGQVLNKKHKQGELRKPETRSKPG